QRRAVFHPVTRVAVYHPILCPVQVRPMDMAADNTVKAFFSCDSYCRAFEGGHQRKYFISHPSYLRDWRNFAVKYTAADIFCCIVESHKADIELFPIKL